MKNLLEKLKKRETIIYQRAGSNLPQGITKFLDFTFDTINTNKSHVIASVFTFGREDLIPDMFINIVKTLNEKNETQISDLLYYLRDILNLMEMNMDQWL